MAIGEFQSDFTTMRALAFDSDMKKVIALLADGSLGFGHRPDKPSLFAITLQWNADGTWTFLDGSMVLVSPNGTKYKLQVLDNGALVTTPL